MDLWHTYCSIIPKTCRDPHKPQRYLHFTFPYLIGVKGSKNQGGYFILCWPDIHDNYQRQIQTVLSHKALSWDGHHQFYWAAENMPLVTKQTDFLGRLDNSEISIICETHSLSCCRMLSITCYYLYYTVSSAQSSQKYFKAQPKE